MAVNPSWIKGLNDEDLNFIKNFTLVSGSLKEMAKLYNVTYPTVRVRLNRIISSIQINDDTQDDKYVMLVKRLALDGKIGFDTTKILIEEYRKNIEED